jgi:hypothetical protein
VAKLKSRFGALQSRVRIRGCAEIHAAERVRVTVTDMAREKSESKVSSRDIPSTFTPTLVPSRVSALCLALEEVVTGLWLK